MVNKLLRVIARGSSKDVAKLETFRRSSGKQINNPHGFLQVCKHRISVIERDSVCFCVDTRGKCWGLMNESNRRGRA